MKYSQSSWSFSCANPKDDLDRDGALLRTREHTEFLVREFELGDLWHSYGVVGDIVVCILSRVRA